MNREFYFHLKYPHQISLYIYDDDDEKFVLNMNTFFIYCMDYIFLGLTIEHRSIINIIKILIYILNLYIKMGAVLLMLAHNVKKSISLRDVLSCIS